MPCYDSRDEMDGKANALAAQVLSALLCAVLTENPAVVLKDMQRRWLSLHREVDRTATIYKTSRTVEEYRARSGPQAEAVENMRRFIEHAHVHLLRVGLLEKS